MVTMQAAQREKERDSLDRHAESSGQTGTCSEHAGDQVSHLNVSNVI